MKYNSLNLDETEQTIINVVSRDNKFAMSGTEIIYPQTNIDKLRFFIDSYKFLFSLSKTKSVTIAIQNKIELYLKQFVELYDKANILYIKINVNINFGKNSIMNKIDDFMLAADEKINSLIAEIFPLGKVIKSFDPDESQGLY